ncbi:hypothetical protein KP509_01G066800 [Ceratopteris richardii]|uniref:Uncharacterized protein n=1 Tax=Ceratopteris richardii TaxID=49495 RepID=A0A8T2VKJ3_CERRI|nr:hypothetical protein KP509_01G066800 [Ceratopteris richardii]
MAFDDDIVEESKTTSLSQCTGPNQRLIDMVLSNPDKLLLQALNIRNKKSASGQAVLDYCKALFSILGPPARRNSSSRPATVLLHLVVRLLTIVQGNRIAVDRTFAQCLELIIQELDAVPSKSIPHIVEPIVNQMQNSGFAYGSDADDVKILRIIPRSLSIICNSSQLVEVPESDGNANFCIGGSEYVESVFKRMLSSPIWTKTVLLEIATLLPEMPLDEAYVAEFVHTILSHLRNVDPIEYPAIMYQLLLLASKKFKRHILVGILAFCSSTFSVLQEATSDKDIAKKSSVESCRQVEGTILLHINFAVKQNPALGQEVVNLVKSGCLPFTSFIFSVLLSLARIRRFEESSMNLLKVFASKAYQDWRMSRSSSCITPGLKKQCLEGVASLERAIMRTVQNTAFGWDHVIPTLVSFGFMMVEASQSGDPVHADTTVKPIQSSGCKDLGAMVLQTTFEVHELARHEIVEQSKSRILQLKHEQSTTIVRMIGQLVQANPHIMLDHICHLKECLDYYAFLHPSLAASLFQSIRPLFQLSSDLQGYAILVLRKAMFGRETTARINALQGLINLLIAERDLKARNDIDSLLNSSNEASCSQQGHIYPNRMPSLLNELKGLLRRCLSQQAKIRELLYQGLVKLVMIDPSAADIAFNLLWSHFCRYYKTAEDSNLPLDIGSCVKIQSNSAFVEEPLDHLIFSIYNLITLQPQEEEQNILSNPSDDFSLSQEFEDGRLSAISSLRDAFQNMRKSLIQGSLAALNMDKSQDFSVDTVEGRKNLEKAHICLGICEILIDSAVSQVVKYPTGPRKDEAEKDLLCCIATYHAIEEILQKHANGSGCRSRPLEPSLSVKPVGKMQSGSIQSMETSKPFLSAVNSLHLLRIAQKSDGLQMPQSAISVPSSQRNDQEQLPDIMSYRYRLAHLAIKSCLRHVKAAGTVFVHSENRYDVKELGGDWKILGRPILDAVDDAVIESSGVFSWSVQKKEREKQGRGKRSAEESREGLVLILVKCLDEIWRLAEKKNCISEVFSQPMGKSCDTVSIESSELRAKISSDSVSEQAFLGELMSASIQPLLEQLLHRSQFREFEEWY